MYGITRARQGEPGGPIGAGAPSGRRRAARSLLVALVSLSTILGVTAAQPAPVAAATYAYMAPLPVPFFSQHNSLWATTTLGTCSVQKYTIGGQGCAVTSMAMLYAYYGISVQGGSVKGMSPSILNAWLKANGGFGSDCDIVWSKVPPTIVFGYRSDWPAATLTTVTASERKAITDQLAAGRPVIASVRWQLGTTWHSHFVVITGQATNGDFYVNDPNPTKQVKTATLFTSRGSSASGTFQLRGIRTYEWICDRPGPLGPLCM